MKQISFNQLQKDFTVYCKSSLNRFYKEDDIKNRQVNMCDVLYSLYDAISYEIDYDEGLINIDDD